MKLAYILDLDLVQPHVLSKMETILIDLDGGGLETNSLLVSSFLVKNERHL